MRVNKDLNNSEYGYFLSSKSLQCSERENLVFIVILKLILRNQQLSKEKPDTRTKSVAWSLDCSMKFLLVRRLSGPGQSRMNKNE